MHTILCWSLVWIWRLFVSASSSSDITTVIENDPRRMVIIGDIHGSLDNFKQIAQETQLIDESGEWIANDTIFIQMGDLVHRREENVNVIRRLFKYQKQAPDFNSNVLLIMGNHDYEQIKWNPQQKAAFEQPGSWYMPDYKQFYQSKLNKKLRKLKLLYKVNGFVFVHAGIEKKHLEVAGTTDIDELNQLMSTTYFNKVTFKNQQDPKFQTQRQIASTVWLQWLHDNKRNNVLYCDRVHEALDMLDAHTMVVGHYFPSSQQTISNDCDGSIIFADVGMWYNYLDALIIENDAITTLSGTQLTASNKYQTLLNAMKAEL